MRTNLRFLLISFYLGELLFDLSYGKSFGLVAFLYRLSNTLFVEDFKAILPRYYGYASS